MDCAQLGSRLCSDGQEQRNRVEALGGVVCYGVPVVHADSCGELTAKRSRHERRADCKDEEFASSQNSAQVAGDECEIQKLEVVDFDKRFRV